MSRGLTIFLAVLAVAAVLFLAVFEPLTESRREREARDGGLLDFDPATITLIEITSGDDVVEIVRKGEGWQIKGPENDRASTDEVNRLFQAAGTLELLDRIPASEFKDSSDLSEFGLKKPKQKLDFKGDDNATLLFGKDGARENQIYVRLDNSRDVYLVSDELQHIVFRNPREFRDRRLTDLRSDQVDRVIVSRKDGEMEIKRDSRGWQLVRPLTSAADADKMKAYLDKLLGLRILEFPDEEKSDTDVPGDSISIYPEDSNEPQVLKFGKQAPGNTDTVSAKFSARQGTFLLPADAVKLLEATPDSLRDQRLLPINLDMVDAIRIESADGTISLTRKDSGWEMDAGGTIRPASDPAVRRLADALSTAQITSHTPATADEVAKAGLMPAKITISFNAILSENTPEARAGEQTVARIALGSVTGGQVAAQIGESSEITFTSDSLLNAIPLIPADWAAPK